MTLLHAVSDAASSQARHGRSQTGLYLCLQNWFSGFRFSEHGAGLRRQCIDEGA
ncbi:hypothetical protein [Natrinema sp. CBA1119]|uniref:hypothetical protein n=1 Tax=Natrinema sp. CBA1119 TaxID=1608465 RepID=UPI00159BC21A|nr:hypothetical protein [Natrinema sp. CBA1119]